MLLKRNLSAAVIVLLLASLFVLAGAAFAEEGKRIKVQIKKLHVDCGDGEEDCGKRMILRHGGGEHATKAHFAWATAHADSRHEKVAHLGVALTALTPELKEHFGLPDSSGVMVSKVLDESAAAAAGLAAGDIISAVDGEAVSSPAELSSLIRSREGGDTVVVETWRNGQLLQLLATLDESDQPVRIAHRRVIKCEDGDCSADIDLDHTFNFSHDSNLSFDFDFGCEDDNCEVLIDCEDGDCECTVDGESADCPDLERLHSLHR